jgi:uncharacterized membrane protein
MATLTAWAFPGVDDAEQASQKLQALQTQELIKIEDAAVVSWEPGKKKPKTRQLSNMTAAGALGGTFWGMLFGLIFFVPLLGAAIGAGIGALAGSMTDVGISDDFIDSVKQRVTPRYVGIVLAELRCRRRSDQGCLQGHPRRADRKQPFHRARGQAARGLHRRVSSTPVHSQHEREGRRRQRAR